MFQDQIPCFHDRPLIYQDLRAMFFLWVCNETQPLNEKNLSLVTSSFIILK